MAGYFEAIDLGKTYKTPGGDAVIVDGFQLEMHEGEFVCIIGHSGCGKSTVLSMVAGLNEITEGTVVLGGRESNGAAPDRGVVFQAPCLLPWMTAFGNVMIGVKVSYPHVSKAERTQMVEAALSMVGLKDSMQKYPREMSGGMQQRVGIARAIALKPRFHRYMTRCY